MVILVATLKYHSSFIFLICFLLMNNQIYFYPYKQQHQYLLHYDLYSTHIYLVTHQCLLNIVKFIYSNLICCNLNSKSYVRHLKTHSFMRIRHRFRNRTFPSINCLIVVKMNEKMELDF